jgi:hypothetical protein
MTTKTLMVCGCSFSAPSTKLKYTGTHFSQVLAKKLNYKLINLAYQGCSNGGIRIQIDEVIRQKPDFAIIIPTFSDRIEIPASGLQVDYNNLSWFEFDKLVKNDSGYDESKGINNINCTNNLSPSLICENFVSVVNNWKHDYRNKQQFKPEIAEALKNYVSYLYDQNWKTQQDRWIIEHGALELVKNNIPFIIIPTIWLWKHQISEPKILDKKYYTVDYEYCPLTTSRQQEYSIDDNWNADPGYHTNVEGQIYLANMYEKLMKERWNIC